MVSAAERPAVIAASRAAALQSLRSKPFHDLSRLPEAQTQAIDAGGKAVKLTTFKEAQKDGSLAVLVRSDEPLLLGLVSKGATQGFIMNPDGSTRDLTDQEILEFFS